MPASSLRGFGSFSIGVLIVGFVCCTACWSFAEESTSTSTTRSYQSGGVHVPTALNTILDNVVMESMPARQAFEMVSLRAGLPMVIQWRRLEAAGIDPDMRIDIRIDHISTSRLLDLMMSEIGQDVKLMWEQTEWYVRILTKDMANEESYIRQYSILELIQRVPNFEPPVNFSLSAMTSQRRGRAGGGGGGAGGGGQGLFEEDDNDDDQFLPSKEERGEQIAQLVRDTIEPDLWESNGGIHGRVSYFQGSLIVRAPAYVHRQIGGSSGFNQVSTPGRGVRSTSKSRSVNVADPSWNRQAVQQRGGRRMYQIPPRSPYRKMYRR